MLSGENTPFDESIKALSDWLQKIEEEIKESNDKNIANLRRTMLKVGRKMLMLAEQAREKWLKTYRQELEELIESLRSGRAKVIISGDPFNEDRSFVVHLYTENLTINVARVAKSGSITIEMAFTGLRGGTHIAVPKLFDENKLRAMQYGLLLTDGSIHKRGGYPVMGTNQLWQAIAWLLAWPGRNHMYVDGVGINGNDVGIAWKLMAIDHKDEVRSKAEVAGEVGKLSSDDFVIFLLFAVLGDGDVDVEEKFVRLHMGESKRELWGQHNREVEEPRVQGEG
ncbi:hypothetical protein [Vulcanisaeta distributa]|uniref:hypothetical protein n=1 Tax=Vulcanisaeta distributa TaxID=164451 RepID=UPI001FB459E1|nr:hypothetical protein [Vulcanisaeta distributa]